MSQSPLLASFDPFATHPFTNNSGLAPRPPQPSQYPIPIPSPPHRSHYLNHFAAASPATSASPSSPPLPVSAPQPRRPSSPPSAPQPIFVPFKHARSSTPDLSDVLAKKKSSSKPASSSK